MKHHCYFIEMGSARTLYEADLPRVPNINEVVIIEFSSIVRYRVVEVYTNLIPGRVEITYTVVVKA